jgi:hypothetical protein
MEEEFYATIKLVSGEEIFSKVCPCDEEDEIILILENPVIIENIVIPGLNHKVVSVNPWIKNTDEEIFLVKLDKVITIIEVKSKEIIKIYKKYIKSKNKESKRIEVTPNMGFVSSIDDARRDLEKIYRQSKI